MKEHLALVQLCKDGFVKGGSDKFEIILDAPRVAETYGGNAKLFYKVLTGLLDGLRKSGFSVHTKSFRSKVGLKVGLPYAGYEDGLLMDIMSFQIEDVLDKSVEQKATVYICEKIKEKEDKDDHSET